MQASAAAPNQARVCRREGVTSDPCHCRSSEAEQLADSSEALVHAWRAWHSRAQAEKRTAAWQAGRAQHLADRLAFRRGILADCMTAQLLTCRAWLVEWFFLAHSLRLGADASA